MFLSFTLSQAGMARRWWKSGHLKPGEEIQEPGSTVGLRAELGAKMVINGFGSVCTFVVMLVFASTKFSDGAWIVILLTPLLVAVFFAIHHHYKDLARRLSLENIDDALPRVKRHRVILPIGGVHRGTLAALRMPARCPTTSPPCMSRSTRPKRRKSRASGISGATASGW